MDINEKIKMRYNRISGIYEAMDKMIKEEWRLNLLSKVSGNVLEVGIGTGGNLSYYPTKTQSLTGVDFSKGMLKHANEKASKGDFSFPIELMEADIQELPFPDDTFDSVVATCVFCSVPDPLKGFEELRRVCKPSGSIYMLEHMRSENKAVGLLMDMVNPVAVGLWGANINRETIKTIERSGLKLNTNSCLMGTIFREMIASPNK